MALGLVLGGGGPIGIAWEIGVLAGLEEEGALKAAEADVIIGTSAGSVVGSEVRLGRSLGLLEDNEKVGEDVAAKGMEGIARDPSIVMEVFRLWGAPEPMDQARAAKIGAKALEAGTADEDMWVGLFEDRVGAEWPPGDLRLIAVNCTTGERTVWTSASDVPLCRAVASSCAVPGLYPPVTIGGARYTDGGVWSSGSADVLLGTGVNACLFLGPMVGESGVGLVSKLALDREAQLLAAEGIATHSIVPGERFSEAGITLFDGSRRDDALAIGRQQGKEAAAELRDAFART